MTDGMSSLEEDLNDAYIPLRVGDITLGWFQPYEVLPDNMPVIYDCDISVVMGEEIFELDENSFYPLLRSHAQNPEELDAFSYIMSRQQSIAIKVPPGSLEVSRSRTGHQICITDSSAHSLFPALINFERAFQQEIQRHFNTLSPIEAMHECIKLSVHGFQKEFLNQLTWRGRTAREIISSSMTFSSCFPNKTRYPNLDPLIDSFKGRVSTLRGVASILAGLPPSRVNNTTPYPFPEWNCLVLTESEHEACQIEEACLNDSQFIQKVFASLGRTIENDRMTLYIARPNDPFVEWIIGETVPARKILELSSHLG